MENELYESVIVTLKYSINKIENLKQAIQDLGWPEDKKGDYEYGDYEEGYDCALGHSIACIEDTLKGLEKELKQITEKVEGRNE